MSRNSQITDHNIPNDTKTESTKKRSGENKKLLMGRVWEGLKLFFFSRKISALILMQLQQIYVQSTQGSFTSSVTHRRETCILKNTVMKQSRELSGDLKPEHTNKTQTGPR